MVLYRDSGCAGAVRVPSLGSRRRDRGLVALPNVGLLPTGSDGLMFSINAKTRKQLGKELGEVVQVTVRSQAAKVGA